MSKHLPLLTEHQRQTNTHQPGDPMGLLGCLKRMGEGLFTGIWVTPKAATPLESPTPAEKMTFPKSRRSLLSADCTGHTWGLPNIMGLYSRERLHTAGWEAQEEEAVISGRGNDCPHPSFDERMSTVPRPNLEHLLKMVDATLGLYSQIPFLPSPEGCTEPVLGCSSRDLEGLVAKAGSLRKGM